MLRGCCGKHILTVKVVILFQTKKNKKVNFIIMIVFPKLGRMYSVLSYLINKKKVDTCTKGQLV